MLLNKINNRYGALKHFYNVGILYGIRWYTIWWCFIRIKIYDQLVRIGDRRGPLKQL